MSDEGRLEVPSDLPCGEPLRSVLARLLAAAPTDRYPTAKAARAALYASSTALMYAPNSSTVVQTGDFRLMSFGPVPRPLTGENAELLDRVSHSMWELMDPDEKPGVSWNGVDVLLTAFFSVVTIGILPGVFWSLAVRRRRRYRTFIAEGVPAAARVLEMTEKEVGFGVKHTKVRYEFEVDGRLYRDADLVLPVIAGRWDPGTIIQVLYLPNRDCESVIISTS